MSSLTTHERAAAIQANIRLGNPVGIAKAESNLIAAYGRKIKDLQSKGRQAEIEALLARLDSALEAPRFSSPRLGSINARCVILLNEIDA